MGVTVYCTKVTADKDTADLITLYKMSQVKTMK